MTQASNKPFVAAWANYFRASGAWEFVISDF
jgi:hypothetical protein